MTNDPFPDEQPPPRLSPSEQLEWGVHALKDRRDGESVISQDDLAAEMREQARGHATYDSIENAAEAVQSERDRAAASAAASRRAQAAQEVRAEAEAAQRTQLHKTVDEQLPTFRQEYAERLQDFAPRVEALSRIEDPQAREAMERTLMVEAERLGRQAHAARQAATLQERQRLHQLRPGLADEATREAFLRWGEHKFGITRQQAESITDMGTILRGFDEFQAEQRQAAETKAAAEAPDPSPKRHRRIATRVGIPQEQTVGEMQRALKRSGRMDDAVSLLAAKREAAADG